MLQYNLSFQLSRDSLTSGIKCSSELEDAFLRLPVTEKLQILKYTAMGTAKTQVQGGDRPSDSFCGLMTVIYANEGAKVALNIKLDDDLKDLDKLTLNQCFQVVSKFLIDMGITFYRAHEKKAKHG